MRMLSCKFREHRASRARIECARIHAFMSVEVATDEEPELDDGRKEDRAWTDFHRFQCLFASRVPQTEQVRKWKVNKTGRGKTNLIKRGKVIKYHKASEGT